MSSTTNWQHYDLQQDECGMSTEIKLKKRRDEIIEEIGIIHTKKQPHKQALGVFEKEITLLSIEEGEIAGKLADLKKKPRVSDHALVRWLERKYGFDFEDERKKILDKGMIVAMENGAEGVKKDGGTFKIKGKTVTTFIRGGVA